MAQDKPRDDERGKIRELKYSTLTDDTPPGVLPAINPDLIAYSFPLPTIGKIGFALDSTPAVDVPTTREAHDEAQQFG